MTTRVQAAADAMVSVLVTVGGPLNVRRAADLADVPRALLGPALTLLERQGRVQVAGATVRLTDDAGRQCAEGARGTDRA
jgi:hypothetical protein